VVSTSCEAACLQPVLVRDGFKFRNRFRDDGVIRRPCASLLHISLAPAETTHRTYVTFLLSYSGEILRVSFFLVQMSSRDATDFWSFARKQVVCQQPSFGALGPVIPSDWRIHFRHPRKSIFGFSYGRLACPNRSLI